MFSVLEHCWILKTYHVVMVLGFYLALLCVCTGCIFHFQFLGEKHTCDQFYLNLPQWKAKIACKIKFRLSDKFSGILLWPFYASRCHIFYIIHKCQHRTVTNWKKNIWLCLSGKGRGRNTTPEIVEVSAQVEKNLRHYCTMTIW